MYLKEALLNVKALKSKIFFYAHLPKRHKTANVFLVGTIKSNAVRPFSIDTDLLEGKFDINRSTTGLIPELEA